MLFFRAFITQHKVAMRARVDTPAFQARLLHHMVKTFLAEMELEGYTKEASYAVLLNAVMRLAFEQNGEAGVAEVLALMDKLADGLERPRLQAIRG